MNIFVRVRIALFGGILGLCIGFGVGFSMMVGLLAPEFGFYILIFSTLGGIICGLINPIYVSAFMENTQLYGGSNGKNEKI